MQEKEQKISPIKQRILQYAESLGISKRAFYAAIDVSRGTLEAKTGITEDVLVKFITTYPNVSLRWLILGEGESVSNNVEEKSSQELQELVVDQQKTIKYLRERLEGFEGKRGAEETKTA